MSRVRGGVCDGVTVLVRVGVAVSVLLDVGVGVIVGVLVTVGTIVGMFGSSAGYKFSCGIVL